MIDPIECLELHLREVSLNGYRGRRPDINFANFFILDARVIKVMRFGIKLTHNDRWWTSQHKRLQLDNKVSTKAHFGLRPLHISFDWLGFQGVESRIGG
jgi:hypothetical protein